MSDTCELLTQEISAWAKEHNYLKAKPYYYNTIQSLTLKTTRGKARQIGREIQQMWGNRVHVFVETETFRWAHVCVKIYPEEKNQ